MTEHVGVLLYIAVAAGLGIVMFLVSYKVGPRRLDLLKATAYESINAVVPVFLRGP